MLGTLYPRADSKRALNKPCYEFSPRSQAFLIVLKVRGYACGCLCVCVHTLSPGHCTPYLLSTIFSIQDNFLFCCSQMKHETLTRLRHGDFHMYKLKTALPRQTNCRLTHVKVILCSNVVNTQTFKTHKEVRRLSILISWVKPLRTLEAGLTSASYLRSSGPCLGITIIAIPSRTTYWNVTVSLRGSATCRSLSLNLCCLIRTPV